MWFVDRHLKKKYCLHIPSLMTSPELSPNSGKKIYNKICIIFIYPRNIKYNTRKAARFVGRHLNKKYCLHVPGLMTSPELSPQLCKKIYNKKIKATFPHFFIAIINFWRSHENLKILIRFLHKSIKNTRGEPWFVGRRLNKQHSRQVPGSIYCMTEFNQ